MLRNRGLRAGVGCSDAFFSILDWVANNRNELKSYGNGIICMAGWIYGVFLYLLLEFCLFFIIFIYGGRRSAEGI